ncbi:response regulator transcription factor [Marinimicrobium agarilyticum]|uniref:response regulator transcription factor n=1 Tax=Marinimicrobium agarilyticum TaxID=306546 RepID=UPI0003FEA37B|nr:response regulator [Marinimicrobium agarilyticum]
MSTLVMIDDDEVFRELMSRRLEREGFRVLAFASVEAADAFEGEPVNVVLLDLMLGAESSLGAIEHLNRRFQPAQLVVLTGYASIATTVEAMKRGATNYLAKPVALSQLLSVLKDEARTASPSSESARRVTPAELEWEHIQRVLLEHDGNISLTARALGMHRRTLQRKLKKHSPF